ncbi:hypothetical protein BZA77DRAFT_69615 [Pyronema omphalodes]|nr:hypothetical protein BZA77DRAFT_69615 [Pyronema omphalodes]
MLFFSFFLHAFFTCSRNFCNRYGFCGTKSRLICTVYPSNDYSCRVTYISPDEKNIGYRVLYAIVINSLYMGLFLFFWNQPGL